MTCNDMEYFASATKSRKEPSLKDTRQSPLRASAPLLLVFSAPIFFILCISPGCNRGGDNVQVVQGPENSQEVATEPEPHGRPTAVDDEPRSMAATDSRSDSGSRPNGEGRREKPPAANANMSEPDSGSNRSDPAAGGEKTVPDQPAAEGVPGQSSAASSDGQPAVKPAELPQTGGAASPTESVPDSEAAPKTAAKKAPASAESSTSAEAEIKPATDPPKSNPPATETADDSPVADGPESISQPREPLFENWPKPQAAIFITGRQHGYIEPCGCTGLANQKGGLARRHSLWKQLIDRGWPLVGVDVGNQVRRFGRQPEIKFQMTVEGLKGIGYHAITFGPDDLRLSSGELLALTASDGDQTGPFLCANAAVIDTSLTPKYRVVDIGGKKIGITAVLGNKHLKKITNDEIVLSPPEEALAEVWAELAKKNCDLHILLAHASIDESIQFAQRVPHFDLVVTAGGAGEPTRVAERIPETESVIVQVGTKGMYVGVLGIFDDPQQPLRYQRIPLDDRFADSPEMLKLLASYQQQLRAAGLEGLGIKPIPHPSGHQFVGSEACADCHDSEYEVWKKTTHSHALDSLIHPGERSEIQRHFDPECLSCHVTGWNPQQYFPYKSGYLSVEKTPLMHHSGCENCHGPGSAHVAAESGEIDATDEMFERLREQMRLPLEKAEAKCMECHDLDNSPDFHVKGAFEKYWAKIAH